MGNIGERTFGRTFKALRIYRKGCTTQEDLIKDFYNFSGIKLQKSTISMYENDKRKPEIDLLVKFADYFETTVDYLLGLSDVEIRDVKNSIDSVSRLFLSLSEADRKEALKYLNYLKIQGSENKEGE